MEPVPLALAPQAEGVGGLHRAGDVEIALEHLGEVHNVGDLPALQIDLQHLVLHGLTLQVGGQSQDGALGAPVDVVVELVLAQVEDLGHLAEAVEPGHLGAAHAGDKAAVVVPQEAVGVVALQHHLVAHDAVVVVEEGVAVLPADAHGVVQAVGERLGAVAVHGLQGHGVARGGLRHIDGEGGGLGLLALAVIGGEGDGVLHAGHQADEQEFLHPAVAVLPGVVGPGGVVGDGVVLHRDGVLHLGGVAGAKVQVQPVGAGAEGVQDGQGGSHGVVPLLGQAQQRGGQAVLDFLVVVGKALVLVLVGDDLGDFNGGLHRVGVHGDLLGGFPIGHVAGVNLPIGAGGDFRLDEGVCHGAGDEVGSHGQHHQRRHHDQNDEALFPRFCGLVLVQLSIHPFRCFYPAHWQRGRRQFPALLANLRIIIIDFLRRLSRDFL
ncbi:unknown [Firmicutes bacterium CAG:94]|nr:unknown [Firmicutes bacterium CAG:94]